MLKVIFITRNINVDCRTISCSVYCTIVYILWIWRATCSFCQSPCYFVGQKVSVRTIFECSLFSTFKGKIINTSLYPFCFQFVIFLCTLYNLCHRCFTFKPTEELIALFRFRILQFHVTGFNAVCFRICVADSTCTKIIFDCIYIQIPNCV